MIKLVPSDPDLREIVLKHDLFKKELFIYQQVIPKLQAFVTASKSSKLSTRYKFIESIKNTDIIIKDTTLIETNDESHILCHEKYFYICKY